MATLSRVTRRSALPRGACARGRASYFPPWQRRRAEVLGRATSVCVFEWTKWRRLPRLTKVSCLPLVKRPLCCLACHNSIFLGFCLFLWFLLWGPYPRFGARFVPSAPAAQATAPRNGVLLLHPREVLCSVFGCCCFRVASLLWPEGLVQTAQ